MNGRHRMGRGGHWLNGREHTLQVPKPWILLLLPSPFPVGGGRGGSSALQACPPPSDIREAISVCIFPSSSFCVNVQKRRFPLHCDVTMWGKRRERSHSPPPPPPRSSPPIARLHVSPANGQSAARIFLLSPLGDLEGALDGGTALDAGRKGTLLRPCNFQSQNPPRIRDACLLAATQHMNWSMCPYAHGNKVQGLDSITRSPSHPIPVHVKRALC